MICENKKHYPLYWNENGIVNNSIIFRALLTKSSQKIRMGLLNFAILCKRKK